MASARGSDAEFGEAGGVRIGPASGTDFSTLSYLDRTGQNTVGVKAILNADLCVALYLPSMFGDLDERSDLWRDCIDSNFICGYAGRHAAWQSPEALLVIRSIPKGRRDLYRIYVTDGMAGTEVLLIENVEGADTGGVYELP